MKIRGKASVSTWVLPEADLRSCCCCGQCIGEVIQELAAVGWVDQRQGRDEGKESCVVSQGQSEQLELNSAGGGGTLGSRVQPTPRSPPQG